MNSLKDNSLNNELTNDAKSNKVGTISSNVELGQSKKEKVSEPKKGYLSWKTLFLLFIIFRILAYFFSKNSIFFAALSLLWGICLALAIVALIERALSSKK